MLFVQPPTLALWGAGAAGAYPLSSLLHPTAARPSMVVQAATEQALVPVRQALSQVVVVGQALPVAAQARMAASRFRSSEDY